MKKKKVLTDEELIICDRVAKNLGTSEIKGVCYSRIYRFFRYTGAHVSVLSNLVKSRIRVVGSNLEWNRPKTGRLMRVPIHPKIENWIEDFLASDLPQYRTFYNNMLQEIGLYARLKEKLSPMTLRHTFVVKLFDLGLTEAEVASLAGCTHKTLQTYNTRDQKITNEKVSALWRE